MKHKAQPNRHIDRTAWGPRLSQSDGFTLIELLVVIAIIGLLASIIFASLASARVKARDARRVSDLQQIQRALELYYADNGTYPAGGAGSDRGCWVNNVTTDLACNPLGTLIVAGKMRSVPHDPGTNTYAGSGCGGAQFYSYWSNGQTYLLGAVSEFKGFSGCTQLGNWNGPTDAAYTYQFYVRNGA